MVSASSTGVQLFSLTGFAMPSSGFAYSLCLQHVIPRASIRAAGLRRVAFENPRAETLGRRTDRDVRASPLTQARMVNEPQCVHSSTSSLKFLPSDPTET